MKISTEAAARIKSLPRVNIIGMAQTMRDAGDGKATIREFNKAEARLTTWGFGFNGLDLYTI